MAKAQFLDDSLEEEQEPFHPNYPQPYHIHIDTGNVALNQHYREKEHGRLKYQAKYQASKHSKRMRHSQ